MLRPQWIGALVFAMVVAAGFAWLGQWQLGRAIESGQPTVLPTEHVKPLSAVAKPNGPIRDDVTGQLVRATGSYVPHDYQIIEQRLNHSATGYWVAAHFALDDTDAAGKPVALAVARGWAPTKHEAAAVIRQLNAQPAEQVTLTGRLLPTEAPETPKQGLDPQTLNQMSVAALYNRWSGVDGADVYSAYVVDHHPPAGLDEIYSPPPIEQTTLNWLNIFYAVEWAVFAGFALYLWYRIVRDVWEREIEDAEEAAAQSGDIDEKVD
ncbi:SURF1 family protein [Microbacterium sp. STN6]|uniref:SURF1 family protein n=1 Tax=Microbacterium sp. STN6 TaxID=2995588 RepID=UPI002260A070|nr:SURF1 family cytochrome oxidase biogenesis protein [Microbacterium sp. STN6]MCX7523275.1 SURF1 family protein [Microbacterium sp. STN6]